MQLWNHSAFSAWLTTQKQAFPSYNLRHSLECSPNTSLTTRSTSCILTGCTVCARLYFLGGKRHLATTVVWNHEPTHLPDICRQRRLRSPTDRRLSLCPRLPTAHRAPPSLCSRRRCAIASVRRRRVDSCFCGLSRTSWATCRRWLKLAGLKKTPRSPGAVLPYL